MDFLRNLILNVQYRFDRLSDSQKRLLTAGGLLIASVIMGILLYLVFFRNLLPQEPVDENVNDDVTGQLPDILENIGNGNGNVNGPTELPEIDNVAQGAETFAEVLYPEEAQDAVLGTDGQNVQFYDPATGRFYRIDSNGQVVTLSDKVFKGVEEATWSNDATKAVMELEDGFNILYDFETEQQYTLHEDMDEFDFSPGDDQISFKFMSDNPDERWLGVANIDGSGAIGIEPLGENGDRVNAQWSPAGHSAGMYYEDVNGDTKEVFPLGFRGENYKKFAVEGRGFDYQWTPNGHQIIYSTYSADNNYNPELHIVEAYGDNMGANNASLNLQTSVDKCTFNGSGTSLYCSVPVNPPTGGGIAPEILDTVQHDIYKVDLTSGTTERVAIPTDAVSGTNLPPASQVMVSEDESVLYYTEATTGRLRRILLQ